MDDGQFTMVDLFAGVGGFRLGFEKAGFKTVYSNDFDKWCKVVYDNYFGENEMDCRDIKSIAPRDVPYADVLTAGFPCQPFSKIGKLHGFADARGTLIWFIANIIRAKQPEAFVLENVANLLRHDKGHTFKRIMEILEDDLGYKVYFDILNTKHFGLPQDRKRIYIVGFRDPVGFRFPDRIPLEKSVGDYLENEVDDFYYLSEKYLSGLKKHKERHAERGHGFGYKILDPNGISTALVVGNMGRERNLIKSSVRKGVNRVGSPLNDEGIRKLTIRECARLQGFPDNYQLNVPVTIGYKMMGNAVSAPVAEAVAAQVRKSLDKHKRSVSSFLKEEKSKKVLA